MYSVVHNLWLRNWVERPFLACNTEMKFGVRTWSDFIHEIFAYPFNCTAIGPWPSCVSFETKLCIGLKMTRNLREALSTCNIDMPRLISVWLMSDSTDAFCGIFRFPFAFVSSWLMRHCMQILSKFRAWQHVEHFLNQPNDKSICKPSVQNSPWSSWNLLWTNLYRVTRQLESYILLTSNWKLRFSIRSLYVDGTFV